MVLELDMDDIKKLFSSFGYVVKPDGYGAYGEDTYRVVTKKDGKLVSRHESGVGFEGITSMQMLTLARIRYILKHALAFGVERSIGEDQKIYEDDWTLMQPTNGPTGADSLVELLDKKMNVYRGKNAAQMMIAYDLYIAGECTR